MTKNAKSSNIPENKNQEWYDDEDLPSSGDYDWYVDEDEIVSDEPELDLQGTPFLRQVFCN